MRAALEAFLNAHQITLYTALFFATLGGVVVWESGAPLRQHRTSLRRRWIGNFGIMFLNTALIWVVFPGAAVGTSLAVWSVDGGLLRWLDVPYWPAFVLGVLLMDLSRYTEHFLLHCLGPLWRIHRVHHTDLDFDVSTAVRFHPAEALVTNGVKIAVVAILGVPVAAVLIYELCYPVTTFWVHANVRLPIWADRAMRWLVLTPNMHRVHHSVLPAEQNSNFGGLFSFWDRLFGTYRAEPAGGHLGMQIGVSEFRDERHLALPAMLMNPVLVADAPVTAASTAR